MDAPRDEPLKREIGFAGSAFLSFNGVVGAGIFALPATLYTQFGAFSPWVFPLFGLLVLAIALPFARTAGHFGVSGGPVVYAGVWGPAAAFQAGWVYYVARVTALAANSNVLVAYLAAFLPGLKDGLGRAATILGVVAVLTAVNVVGVKRAVRLLDGLTVLKALPLVAMALLGLVMAGGRLEAPSALPPIGALEAAALLVLYAFVGFENSVVPAGETADPKRTIPRALVATILATAALYFIVQLAFVAVMAPGQGGDAPMAAFGTALIGPIGGVILTAAAIFSLLGNISGGITATTRTTYAMARDGLLPAPLARVSARWATPVNSILLMGALIAALALTGSFVWLAVVSVAARLVVYAFGIAALPRVERPSILWWALIAAGLAVCLWAATQSAWPSWRMLLILMAAGTVLYLIARRGRRGAQAGSSSAGTVSSIQPPPSTRSPS